MMQKAYDEIKGGSGFTDDYKYDADVLADEYAKQKGVVYTDLPQDQMFKYYDPALKRVQQDLQIKRAKKIAQKNLADIEQKIELQMFDTKGRKPNAEGGIAGELHLNQGGRIGYAKGTKKLGEGMYNPVGEGDWLINMPNIDPNRRKLMEEYKKRKGLAEILGV